MVEVLKKDKHGSDEGSPENDVESTLENENYASQSEETRGEERLASTKKLSLF